MCPYVITGKAHTNTYSTYKVIHSSQYAQLPIYCISLQKENVMTVLLILNRLPNVESGAHIYSHPPSLKDLTPLKAQSLKAYRSLNL